MPGSDERQPALLTIAIKRDDGENIEIKQQPIDIFAETPGVCGPFLQAIGKLIIQAGHIEYLLSEALSKCRKLDTECPPETGKIREAGRRSARTVASFRTNTRAGYGGY